MGAALIALYLHGGDGNVLRPEGIEILRISEIIAIQPVGTSHHLIDLLEQTLRRITPDLLALLHRIAVRHQVLHIPIIEAADAILRRGGWFGSPALTCGNEYENDTN